MFANLFKRSNKEYVALDIGNQNTKILSFSPKGVIHNFLIEPTVKGAFDSGVITDQDKLSSFLTTCIGQLDILTDVEVITGIHGKGLITKKIDVARMSEKLMSEHLIYEAEQYLPYEIDEIDLDFEILKDIETSNPSEMVPVLIVAILKETVQQYNDLLEKSLLECNILDTNHFALFNTFEKNYDLDPNQGYLLIDIGSHITNMVMVVKNQVLFTRSLFVGGNFYNKAIERHLNVSYDEAEELKKSVGQETDHAENVASIIQKDINPLFCDELLVGYESYLSFFPKNPVSQIYITGGGSLSVGLLEALSTKFQMSSDFLNPIQNLKIPPEIGLNKDIISTFGSVVSGLFLRIL